MYLLRRSFPQLKRLLGFGLLWLVAACQGKRLQPQVSFQTLPERTVLALSVVDACIVAVDARQPKVVGTLKSPFFKASTDLVALTSGEIALTLDADAEHDYRDIVFLDPVQGKETARVTVEWAPVRLGLSPAGFLLVAHSLEKASNGLFTLSILDVQARRMVGRTETNGYIADMAFDGQQAYLGVVAVRPGEPSGILIYDVAARRTEAFHPVPQPPDEPPWSPHALALDGDRGHLYTLLFQFDATSPCQQHGRLVRLDVHTGTWTPILDLPDVGPLLRLSDGTLVSGEMCSWGEGRLFGIDPASGTVRWTQKVGPGIQDLVPVSDQVVVASVAEVNRVVFFEAQNGEINADISLPCAWPGALTLRSAP